MFGVGRPQQPFVRWRVPVSNGHEHAQDAQLILPQRFQAGAYHGDGQGVECVWGSTDFETKTMSRTLELPEPVYDRLLKAASQSGVTPADWIAERLPSSAPALTSEEARASALERLQRCAVSSGMRRGGDNDRIDTDLVREYEDRHTPTDSGTGPS